jgi:hypothetical protein
MKKSESLQTEIRRYDFSTFLTEEPSMANGGPGVVVPGCPACRKRLFTMANFMDHLADDALSAILDRLSASRDTDDNGRAHKTRI